MMFRRGHHLALAGWLLWSIQWVNQSYPVPQTRADIEAMQEWRVEQRLDGPVACAQAMALAHAQQPDLVLTMTDTDGRQQTFTFPRDFRCVPDGQSPQ